MTRRPALPGLVLWLLRWRLPSERAEFVLGDLEEEWRRRDRHSRGDAAVWLIRQAVVCILTPAPRQNTAADVGDLKRGRLSAGHLWREGRRSFRARPLFIAACVGILAAGIGSATAVSAAAYALLFRPLPLPASERLLSGYALREGFDPFGTSPLEYTAFNGRVAAIESFGLARRQVSTVRASGETVRIQTAAVTAGYLDTAGVVPAVGRTISALDDSPGSAAVAVISHSLWVRHLARRPDVVGQTLAIDGRPSTIVGVLPAGFDLPYATEIWVPLQMVFEALPLQDQLASAYTPIARLRAGVSLARANEEVAAIARALADGYPQRRGWTYRVITLRQQLLGDLDGKTTQIIALVLGAVAFLLVICCVNVGNLMLLRAADRTRDDAIRTAMGASPAQLALERAAECLSIGLSGGLVGLAFAAGITPLLVEIYTTSLCKAGVIAFKGGRSLVRMGRRLVVGGRKGLSLYDTEDPFHPSRGASVGDLDVRAVMRPMGTDADTILASLEDGSARLLRVTGDEIEEIAIYAQAPWFAGSRRLGELLVRIGEDGRSLDVSQFGQSEVI